MGLAQEDTESTSMTRSSLHSSTNFKMSSQQLGYSLPGRPDFLNHFIAVLIMLLMQVQNPIDLPQIAVVGSQSSGKSSVLENIVGRDL